VIHIQYGVLKEATLSHKFGVRALIANVVIRENGKEPIDDAALILCRRSFGVGRSHIVLRGQYHAILDDADLIPLATAITTKLFGSADKDNVFKMADVLLDLADDVVMHPPEDQMKLWKQEQKALEQSGALIRLNDETILDAR